MNKLREEVRQWLLLGLGSGGAIDEMFFAHPFDSTKFLIYLGMLGFSRADFILALFERFTGRVDTPWIKGELHRPPTLEGEIEPAQASEEDDDAKNLHPGNDRPALPK